MGEPRRRPGKTWSLREPRDCQDGDGVQRSAGWKGEQVGQRRPWPWCLRCGFERSGDIIVTQVVGETRKISSWEIYGDRETREKALTMLDRITKRNLWGRGIYRSGKSGHASEQVTHVGGENTTNINAAAGDHAKPEWADSRSSEASSGTT